MEEEVSITAKILGREPGTLVDDAAEIQQQGVREAGTARVSGFSGRAHKPFTLKARGSNSREIMERVLESNLGIT